MGEEQASGRSLGEGNQGVTTRPSQRPGRAADVTLLNDTKAWLLKELEAHGIREEASDLTIRLPRKTHGNRVGYYSAMSQFRSKARLVVDVEAIRAHCEKYGEQGMLHRHVRMTVAHEYGHVMAELMATVASRYEGFGGLKRSWEAEFAGNEELFAEDLARFLTSGVEAEWGGWRSFLIEVGAEMDRWLGEMAALDRIGLL